jgi:hypothetical protein
MKASAEEGNPHVSFSAICENPSNLRINSRLFLWSARDPGTALDDPWAKKML